MKTLVLYYSKTGNTKKIAEAIHSSLSTKHSSKLVSVKEYSKEDIDDYDILYVGAPCHDASLAKPIIAFLNSLSSDHSFKLAGFYTHSTTPPEGSERNKQLFNDWAGLCHKVFDKITKEKKIDFLGDFHCQGKASFLIEKFIHFKIIKEKEEWHATKKEMRLHPTQSDLDNAKEFALNILENIEK